MSRRQSIRMTEEERNRFLATAEKASLATMDADGFPHLVAMGFVAKDDKIYMTSYARAQKVKNIERDPKVGVMVEAGDSYSKFRGVILRGHCELLKDPKLAAWVIDTAGEKKARASAPPRGSIESVNKRVVLKITPQRWATWDHTKLAGKY